jgi:hypothetical protein
MLLNCMFCELPFTPNITWVPFGACWTCICEVNSQLMLGIEHTVDLPPLLVVPSQSCYFWVPERMTEQ